MPLYLLNTQYLNETLHFFAAAGIQTVDTHSSVVPQETCSTHVWGQCFHLFISTVVTSKVTPLSHSTMKRRWEKGQLPMLWPSLPACDTQTEKTCTTILDLDWQCICSIWQQQINRKLLHELFHIVFQINMMFSLVPASQMCRFFSFMTLQTEYI